MVPGNDGHYYLAMIPQAQRHSNSPTQSTYAKALLILIASVLGPIKASAATYPISAGASTATIQSIINTAAAAPGGNTVSFAAGSYSITQGINIPCPASPLTITG